MSELNEKDIQITEDATATVEFEKKQPKRSIVKTILEYIEILVFALAFVILLFTFVIRLCVVSGDSMNHTLEDGERLLVSNVFFEPKYGDIVVFHQTGYLNEPVVKRVIAVEGETIDIDFKDFIVTVTDVEGNTRVLEEDYAFFDPEHKSKYYAHTNDLSFPLVVPEGHLFVMGDNRYNSLDSRFTGVGLVDERRVLGKVIVRLTPLSKIEIIK